MYWFMFLFFTFLNFMSYVHIFFFKQKTAYEMRISDWSSDVCSSDLPPVDALRRAVHRLNRSAVWYCVLDRRTGSAAAKRHDFAERSGGPHGRGCSALGQWCCHGD